MHLAPLSHQAALQQQCLELRSQVISLRSQVDTSQTVQRDFVQLSQSLQVRSSSHVKEDDDDDEIVTTSWNDDNDREMV